MSEQTPRKWRTILLKLGISVAFGCIVVAVTLPVSWSQNRKNWRLNEGQYDTFWRTLAVKDAIEEYTKSNGAAPQSLNQLPSDILQNLSDGTGSLVDGWGRPFQYAVVNGKGVATSYGRDGQPGGIGFDYDLSTEDQFKEPEPAPYRPTLRQFLFESDGPVLFAPLCAGIFSAMVCFGSLKQGTPALPNIVGMIVALLMVTVFAAFVAAFLTAVEMSGH